jgi:2-polyprenyl-3-methyl-5-hydroxy-6-metoxy-1,4-benzoquinol methylase
MTYNIFEKIKKRIKIKNKNFIELGSGLGRLSYLCARKTAKKVTLVDNSEKAIALSKKFFLKKKIRNFKLINQNILNLKKIKKYDVVFSSGVIEHFKKKNRFLIIKKHIDLCKKDCLIMFSVCFVNGILWFINSGTAVFLRIRSKSFLI